MCFFPLYHEDVIIVQYVSPDSMREAIDLLLKAAGYLDFCIRDVLVRLPPDIR